MRTRCSASEHLRLCTLPFTRGTHALWLSAMLPWSRSTITRTLLSLGGVKSCSTSVNVTGSACKQQLAVTCALLASARSAPQVLRRSVAQGARTSTSADGATAELRRPQNPVCLHAQECCQQPCSPASSPCPRQILSPCSCPVHGHSHGRTAQAGRHHHEAASIPESLHNSAWSLVPCNCHKPCARDNYFWSAAGCKFHA